LVLDMEMSQVGDMDTFKREVVADVASAVGISKDRVKVQNIHAGSVIVDMTLEHSANDSRDVLGDLKTQSTNPGSKLMKGKHTRKTRALTTSDVSLQAVKALRTK